MRLEEIRLVVQGGPIPVVNRVITPISGAITLLIACKGPYLDLPSAEISADGFLVGESRRS